jgi:hypothetical protein
MSQPKIAKSSIEQMERKRRQMLYVGAIAFVLWQGSSLLAEGINLGPPIKALLLAVNLSAAVVWALFSVQLVRWGKQLAGEPATARALSDERWEHNRSKATEAAFWAVMLTQCGLVLAFLIFNLDAAVGARITFMVGVTAGFAAFLWHDRE